ncbi:MAG: hypothetical protein AB1551_02900 [Actinomycetota bacterium]
MKRWGSIAVLFLILGLTVPASANVPDSFWACGSDTKKGECTQTVSVMYGQTVHFKGKVQPPHADLEAGVWHKGPNDDTWERWATVAINDNGVMKYEWHTTINDGEQENAHRVQFRIEGHGKSNKVRVYVWLGE